MEGHLSRDIFLSKSDLILFKYDNKFISNSKSLLKMNSNKYTPQTLKSLSYENIWNLLKSKSNFFVKTEWMYDMWFRSQIECLNLMQNLVSINKILPTSLQMNLNNIFASLDVIACKTESRDNDIDVYAVKNFEVHQLEKSLELSDKLCEDIAFRLASNLEVFHYQMDIENIKIRSIAYIKNSGIHSSDKSSIFGVHIEFKRYNSYSNILFNKIYKHLNYNDSYNKTFFEGEDFNRMYLGRSEITYHINRKLVIKDINKDNLSYPYVQYIYKNKVNCYDIEKYLLIQKLLKY